MARGLLDRVRDEATRAYANDEECCGLLVGPASDPRRLEGIVPMVNRANKLHALDPERYPRTGRTYFDLDTLKFQRHVEEGERAGAPVKVLYHSHVDAGAYFSETDADVAKMGGEEPPFDLAYLVVSVRGGSASEHALFVYSPSARGFVASPLTVIE